MERPDSDFCDRTQAITITYNGAIMDVWTNHALLVEDPTDVDPSAIVPGIDL